MGSKEKALDQYLGAAYPLMLILERLEGAGGALPPSDPDYPFFRKEVRRGQKAAAKAGVEFGWLPDVAADLWRGMGHPEGPRLFREFADFLAGASRAIEVGSKDR